MKCITHIDREAVRYCPVCNQPICQECWDYLAGCANCAEKGCHDIKSAFWKTVIISICSGVVGVGFALNTMFPLSQESILISIVIIIGCIGLPFGWRALNQITPDIFLILPLAGWAIYFTIKIAISFCIGWLVAIPKYISMRESIKVNQQVENNLERIKSELNKRNTI